MRMITDLNQLKFEGSSAIAIGKFDGVHLGHQELLHHIIARKAAGMESIVFTFEPSPAVFFGLADKKVLTLKEEKIKLFTAMGVDVLVDFPMNADTAAIPADSFIKEILVEKLHMAYICAGTDLRFGKRGAGDSRLLAALAGSYGYQADIIAKKMHFHREISSSYIKEEVEKGNMPLVSELLGRPFQVTGPVVTGKRLGRTLGMPTANLVPETEQILPPPGVYFTRVQAEGGGTQYPGISNIGYKPTVSDEHILGLETYLYGYFGDLYGKRITVAFEEYKRAEQKFADLAGLKAQLEQDIWDGAVYFGLTERKEVVIID